MSGFFVVFAYCFRDSVLSRLVAFFVAKALRHEGRGSGENGSRFGGRRTKDYGIERIVIVGRNNSLDAYFPLEKDLTFLRLMSGAKGHLVVQFRF